MPHRSPILLAIGAVLLAATACRGDRVAEPDPSASLPALRIAADHRSALLLHGNVLRVPVHLIGAAGDTLPLPGVVTLRSRDPRIATADSATWLTARGPGNTWVVASLVTPSGGLVDSLRVTVMCHGTYDIALEPRVRTLAVGESFVPTVSLSMCNGTLPLADTFRWDVFDGPPIVLVDSVTGFTSALAPGETRVRARGLAHGFFGTVRVIVTPRP